MAVRAWYDGLAGLDIGEALARVRNRRRALWQVQRLESLAGDASPGTDMRHLGQWALENRHAKRVLGAAWVRRQRDEDTEGTLPCGDVSRDWRSAVRDAEGLALLCETERGEVLSGRSDFAVGDLEREQIKLVRVALKRVLQRRNRNPWPHGQIACEDVTIGTIV